MQRVSDQTPKLSRVGGGDTYSDAVTKVHPCSAEYVVVSLCKLVGPKARLAQSVT